MENSPSPGEILGEFQEKHMAGFLVELPAGFLEEFLQELQRNSGRNF